MIRSRDIAKALGGDRKNDNALSSYQFFFGAYESPEAFRLAGERALSKLPDDFSQDYEGLWLNTTTAGSDDIDLLNSGRFEEYIDPDALDEAIDSFDALFENIDMGGAFNKYRLRITEDKRGIFDFGLASKGLFRKQEFFSEELANTQLVGIEGNLKGIVPALYVDKDQMDQYWYTDQATGKKYLMTKQQMGTRAIDLGIPDAKKKFATSTKKSYLMFEKKGGKTRKVDLYIGVGALAEDKYKKENDSLGMLYRNLPLMLAAKFFELANIRTRISATRMFEEFTRKRAICITYPIKDYGEPLDFNKIAIETSDTRWFRWNLWKYTAAIGKVDWGWQQEIPRGWGSTIYKGRALDSVSERYKNWYEDQVKNAKVRQLEVDRNLMLFGGTEAISSKSESLEVQMPSIIKEFYRIVDTVDFQYNQPERAAERIYIRMVEEKGESVADYKAYCQAVLSNAYSFPSVGEWSTPEKEQERMTAELLEKNEALNRFLETRTRSVA